MTITQKVPASAPSPSVHLSPAGDAGSATAQRNGPGFSTWTFDFRHHGGFDKRVRFPAGTVNRDSIVLASATELTFDLVPFQGAASISVDNIVPDNDGSVNFRGAVGWGADLNVRLHILIA
jgi:hypothetical protein